MKHERVTYYMESSDLLLLYSDFADTILWHAVRY